jgi:hypothetical protein
MDMKETPELIDVFPCQISKKYKISSFLNTSKKEERGHALLLKKQQKKASQINRKNTDKAQITNFRKKAGITKLV